MSTEDLLHLSLIYRNLVDDIERIAMGGTAKFSAAEKSKMVTLISEAMGKAVEVFTLRCSECDAPIDPICDDCR